MSPLGIFALLSILAVVWVTGLIYRAERMSVERAGTRLPLPARRELVFYVRNLPWPRHPPKNLAIASADGS